MIGWGFLGWIILGGIAGWIASKIMKRDAQMGILLNIVVGIVGALLGGWLLSAFGVDVSGGGLILCMVDRLRRAGFPPGAGGKAAPSCSRWRPRSPVMLASSSSRRSTGATSRPRTACSCSTRSSRWIRTRRPRS